MITGLYRFIKVWTMSKWKEQIVKKGEVIAEAGRNQFEKDAGVHLYFEVHQNQKPVNPAQSSAIRI